MYISVTTCLSFVLTICFIMHHMIAYAIENNNFGHLTIQILNNFYTIAKKQTKDLITKKCILIFYSIVQSILWYLRFYKAFANCHIRCVFRYVSFEEFYWCIIQFLLCTVCDVNICLLVLAPMLLYINVNWCPMDWYIYMTDYIYLIFMLHDYLRIYWFVSNSFYMLNSVS